jgi:hypothetical protein
VQFCDEKALGPLSIPQRQATVDGDRRARYVARSWRDQKATQFGYFFWCREPAQRLNGLQPGALLRPRAMFVDVLLEHGRVDGPGHHRIYSAYRGRLEGGAALAPYI